MCGIMTHLEEAYKKVEGDFGDDDIKRIELMEGAAEGLVHIHDKKIIHRDIKPSNIGLYNDIYVIIDFSVAAPEKRMTNEKIIVGTPNYMPPEAFGSKYSRKMVYYKRKRISSSYINQKYENLQLSHYPLEKNVKSLS